MNAIPSVRRGDPVGLAGFVGYRDVANKAVLTDTPQGIRGRSVGTWASMKVAHGVLNARPTQGRVGGKPRHVDHPRATHLPHLAGTSATTDAIRSNCADPECVQDRLLRKDRPPLSRLMTRTPLRFFVLSETRTLAPFRSGGESVPVRVEEPFRRKGVRAA